MPGEIKNTNGGSLSTHLDYLRANLTTSTSLQPIRSIHIQLHGPLHCHL
jgi:hypothetical protein